MNMNQDGDDILETGDLDGDPGFEDFDVGEKQSFAEALKNNSTLKLGVVIGAIVLIAGGVMLFGGKQAPVAPSLTARGSDVKETPGMKEVSKEYEEALKERNEQDLQAALQQGGSAIPVPIGPAKNRLEIQPAAAAEDPLERWRRVQEERLRKEKEAQAAQQAPAPTGPAPRPVDPYAEDKKNLANSFAAQMQSILESMTPKGSSLMHVTDPKAFAEERAALAAAALKAQQLPATAGAPNVIEILLEAGRIEYGQTIIEANTDIPGPVVAELASGPLKGSRLIGSFSKTDDYISIQFSTIVVDGVALATKAVAIDPASSRPGMVTEIDRRYFERVILPAAAAFIEGLGGAIADSGSTTVSAGAGTTTSSSADLDTRQEFFKGVEKAADKIGDILDGKRVQPMLKIAAGTHIGILFLESVQMNTAANSNVVAQSAPQPMPAAQPLMFQLQPVAPTLPQPATPNMQ